MKDKIRSIEVEEFNFLEEDDFVNLAKSNLSIRLLFCKKPSKEKLSSFNDIVLPFKKDISLVLISAREQYDIDLAFFDALTLIENIEFHVYVKGFKSLQGMEHFRNLKKLALVGIFDSSLDLSILKSSCIYLEELSVMDVKLSELMYKQLPLLQQVKILNLFSLDTRLLQTMANVEKIVVSSLINVYNFSEVFPNLKCLISYSSRNVESLDFLSKLPQIEFLSIAGMSKVVSLPDFSKCKKLKTISFRRCKNLKYLENIVTATSIEHLILDNNAKQELNELSWLLPSNFPNLKELEVEFSKKIDDQIYARFEKKD